MKQHPVLLGSTPFHSPDQEIGWDLVDLDGQPYLRVSNIDAMPAFFMSIVSDGDPWLFAGSNGAFVAGRVKPDSALFPYLTVDRILERPDSMGARTSLLIRRAGGWSLWEPWQESGRAYALQRNLYKHVHGTSVVYEETNLDLGLRVRTELTTSDIYGIVRFCHVDNLSGDPVEIRYLDGWHQLYPPSLSTRMMSQLSYLAAAYMRHERAPGLPLGIYTLNARLTDLAEPSESLRAAVGWSLGHDNPTVLLSTQQLTQFRYGQPVEDEFEIRGAPGACLIADTITLAPGATKTWLHVADTELDHTALVQLKGELAEPGALFDRVTRAVESNRRGLRDRIAFADGLQHTADRYTSVHHFSNVLFNCMRGGTFDAGYAFPRGDFLQFLEGRNLAVATRYASDLAALPDPLDLDTLRGFLEGHGDPQLQRLAAEYLPLTFSRRHGDPSRPWNLFAIRLKDEQGRARYTYEGNWRDIFQNWEALAASYPSWLPHMISVFLNASTADGYNPYRVTREGIDWEVLEPDDEWGGIGYWGDHQIIYLLRLLEADARYHPGRLAAELCRRAYAYAEVPYEIAGFDALVADPRQSIHFNMDRHEALMARAAEQGGDGKLLQAGAGEVVLATLAEKLLVPLLAKLTNFVPGGGIWLNTQRPEWNDANNALAGWGLSMVTVYYIRRYLAFCRPLFEQAGVLVFELSAPLAGLLYEVSAALSDAEATPAMTFEALGRAGEAYRGHVYARSLGQPARVPLTHVLNLFDHATRAIDDCIRANRREDGLYHAYNTLEVTPDGLIVRHLAEMLEGQVAILSAGLLPEAEVIELLQAMRKSDLYRADQHSYLLYPDQTLTPFLERNTLPQGAAEQVPLLKRLLDVGDRLLVLRDAHGDVHFQGDMTSARDVEARLDDFDATPEEREAVLDLWEQVFNHRAFTGRSSTFFAFEGLGSIYWHMVAKLLLAVQECYQSAAPEHAEALAAAYDDIRLGLGFTKTPEVFGAIPTDPYSHSPRHLGAQQPGMTGQVKEEVITRWGELGVDIVDACLRFQPTLLHRSEFIEVPETFHYIDLEGRERTWDLPAESLGFTVCQVPICYRLGDTARITITRTSGGEETLAGTSLSAVDSGHIFKRDARVEKIEVEIPRSSLRA
ncbi:MAG: hypothetical protein ACE366_23445 [Bradymonadia bacterium]